MLSAQASSAQVKAFTLTVYNYRRQVNIRQPATISVALGMAYRMTELG
jgi:hypothetical protein